MGLNANKAINAMVSGTKKLVSKAPKANAHDYSKVVKWGKGGSATARTKAPIVDSFNKPKAHVAQYNKAVGHVNYNMDLGNVTANKAVNKTAAANQAVKPEAPKKQSTQRQSKQPTEAPKTAQTKKAADQQAAKQVAQNEANRAGNESIKQSNEKIAEMKSQAQAKFQGFLNDVNPKDVSDEYAYIANQRKQKARNLTGANAGTTMTPEKAASLENAMYSSADEFAKKANAGNNSRMDLFKDLADSNAKMSGRTEANLVDKGAAAMEMAGSYFLSGDKSRNTKRIGTAVGAYGATAYGARKLSGGDATYNSSGRRDIVGVPFF